MTLTHLLELDVSLLAYEDNHCLQVAECLFQAAGAPTDRKALACLLETVLLRCQRDGIPYPRVFLLRKRQLEGRQHPGLPSWQPAVREAVLAAQPMAPATGTCTLCGGAGFTVNPGGLSGRICECVLKKANKQAPERPALPGPQSARRKTA